MSSYNNHGSAFPGGPPFFQDTSICHFYTPENEAVIRRAWAESIDPILRSTQNIQDNSYQESKMPFQNQQRPLERFLDQTDNRVLLDHEQMQGFSQAYPQNLSKPSAPIQAVPQSSRTRMISPCPSQEPSSTISSSASPGPDPEWLSDSQYSPMIQPKDDFYFSPNGVTSFVGQGFDWSGAGIGQLPSNSYPRNTGIPCVNMSQIQGLPDLQPEEMIYEGGDEGYGALDMKNEYAVEVKQEQHHSQAYQYHEIDEGIGASIKDEASPQASGSVQTHNSDIDAEGEDDEDEDANDEEVEEEEDPIQIPEPVSDTEYTPKRTSRRKPHRASHSKSSKSGRVSKSTNTSKPRTSSLTCKQCPSLPIPFRTTTDLHTHITKTHQHQLRAYTCVFHFAGCPSTFTSKNEWKRHVSSQHLNLTAWVCELGLCAKSARKSEFNRKDLFTQHLRRMHTPSSIKRGASSKKNGEWEERVKELQRCCVVVKREAPELVGCPVRGCESFFEGKGAWDERMEHVGKHLEKGIMEGLGVQVNQGDDAHLVRWALGEGIIEEKLGCGGGRFRLCVAEKERKGRGASEEGDVDAEGEEDV
ncbi:hypothetical protein HYFRA_00004301 [Hymenoscyphus fraxineus]|uniref:C2H2-type domain-containing protein n=1 Tax=Hymenoscyphus fraxineus TaxID=746836 RepID=A0A9N9PF60_9HELO|nr:hypothetical protein HYFRA_00004301 [Hymenoscyphus fraxineus]